MENAAKALTIAGTILISVLVISAVVFMYRDLTSVKRQDAENQKVQEITDFNKSFESFDKTLNGAKMLSLANKIQDYNTKYVVNMKEGYKDIELWIDGGNINKDYGTEWYKYYSDLQNQVDQMMNDKYISANYLEALNEAKEKQNSSKHLEKEQAGETLKELSQKLGTNYNKAYSNCGNDYQIYEQYLKIKKQTFKPAGIAYDERNGRITKMSYTTQ